MEKIIETRQKVLDFLLVDEHPSDIDKDFDFGNGSGTGYGEGYSDGSGSGQGEGEGYGDGLSDGFGNEDSTGYGDGESCGCGYDDGTGIGSGYNDGIGSGCGYGTEYGCGSGSGNGFNTSIEAVNGIVMHDIDGVLTLIDSVHGNFAKGRMLNNDLTTKPCFIAKYGNYFGHGDTLEDALHYARKKYDENIPRGERIARFNEQYPDRDKKVPAKELFEWHHILTGSCLAGRKHFCRERGLDYENGEYTVNEFISLTMDAYNGSVIRQLEESKP